MSQGNDILCCLEVEDADSWASEPWKPPGSSLLNGSGIGKPQLTGFISYLHFPLVLYIHVWIFSVMKFCSGDYL